MIAFFFGHRAGPALARTIATITTPRKGDFDHARANRIPV
jgi:hypothetical protein